MSTTLQNHNLKNKFEYEFQNAFDNKRKIDEMTTDFISLKTKESRKPGQEKTQKHVNSAINKQELLKVIQ